VAEEGISCIASTPLAHTMRPLAYNNAPTLQQSPMRKLTFPVTVTRQQIT